MEGAFLETEGTLADRMMASLYAAEDCGGDIRGKQLAAMVVVKTRATGLVDRDRVFDLRVEDHPEPLQELSRLLGLYQGYRLLGQGDTALEGEETEYAMELYQQARECLGENPEALYWHGIALIEAGKTGDGLSLLAPLFLCNSNWLELTRRLPDAGLVHFDPSILDELPEDTQ